MLGIVISGLTAAPSSHAKELYQCPEESVAHSAFESGVAQQWPNYSEGAAARVQRQHPDTAIIAAHSKFIQGPSSKFAICQYYTHIGLLITTGFFVVDKTDDTNGGYWRYEYTESTPEEDVKGREMMQVCMEKSGDMATPSVKCPFLLPEEVQTDAR